MTGVSEWRVGAEPGHAETPYLSRAPVPDAQALVVAAAEDQVAAR